MANYFSDRVVQYPGRVTMTPTGASDTYDMVRAEGNVTSQGSPFNSETFNGAIDLYGMWYGTCSTSGSTSAKVVSCSGFKLVTGATIAVKFTNAQTSTSSITLNVNSTGAKTVYGIPRTTTSNTRLDGAWEANETKVFIYDGSYWRLVDQNIITSSELTSLESELGISATASLSRLYGILNELTKIGTTYTASWTASSTSGVAALTDSITLPKGTYVVVVSTPYITPDSGSPLLELRINDTAQPDKLITGFANSYVKGSFIITLTSQSTIRLYSASSVNTNYNSIERGSLKAVRVGSGTA